MMVPEEEEEEEEEEVEVEVEEEGGCLICLPKEER
jgi:hypothetical protein